MNQVYQVNSTMPEGPECKYISSSVNSSIKGNIISGVDIYSGRYKRHGPPIGLIEFLSSLVNREITIEKVCSHGKFIYWQFSNDWYLWNTLGMSGQWSLEGKEHQPHLHLRIRTIDKQGKSQDLWWRDIRNFGTLKWVKGTPCLLKKIGTLGIDILSDIALTRSQWLDRARQLRYSKLSLPVFLMRQNILSGVGNYLKSEALYDCNISPHRLVVDLDDDELFSIYQSVRDIANRSFNSHGASFSTYTGPKSEKGMYGFQFLVYGKEKDPYGHQVVRYVSEDGRTTHWVRDTQG